MYGFRGEHLEEAIAKYFDYYKLKADLTLAPLAQFTHPSMLPVCRTDSAGFAIPTFEVVPSDVAGFMDELWEFQSTFHDCFARSEPRAHFFDYMVGQLGKLERKSIEPMALQVEGGTIRGMQRFISDVHWDQEQMRWNYHQLVAAALGDPEGVLMFDETVFVKKGQDSVGVARAPATFSVRSCSGTATQAHQRRYPTSRALPGCSPYHAGVLWHEAVATSAC